jgi:hypothetical protein
MHARPSASFRTTIATAASVSGDGAAMRSNVARLVARTPRRVGTPESIAYPCGIAFLGSMNGSVATIALSVSSGARASNSVPAPASSIGTHA